MKLILILIVLMLAACSGQSLLTPSTVPTKATITKQAAEFQVIAQKLQTPWAIDFNGEQIYISERVGTIVKIDSSILTRQQVKLNKE
jgi:hypothetical protein